ncbi:MAG: hypothetical protein ACLU80_12115 [Dorea sp.]
MAKKYAKEMTAIYVSTAFQPTFEKEDAIRFCKEYAIPLTILERDVLSQEAVVQNPANRCYYCKKVIFSEIQRKHWSLDLPVWQMEQMLLMMQMTDLV